MSAATAAVVDDDPKTRTRLAMQLGERAVGAFASLDELEDRVPEGRALVVVLGPSLAGPEGLKSIESLIRRRPGFAAILVADELSTSLLQSALRSGVRDVLAAPVDTNQLEEAIARVSDTLPSAPRAEVPVAVPGDRGRVISVFSPKGGTGKSVIACNLAVALKRNYNAKVGLIDADLQFGDVAVMLKLTPQHTIVDAVTSIERLDTQLLQSLLVRHEPSGVMVLPAPIEPAFADQVGAAEMVKIIDIMREICDFVIVDTTSWFTDVVISLLEQSDDIVLVAGMDIPNIKNVKIGLQTLRLLNTPVSKVKLVLNRANSKVKLDVAEVERTLQLKADTLVPSDVAVPQSVNKGVPILLDAPKSGVSRSIEQLAGLFAGDRKQ